MQEQLSPNSKDVLTGFPATIDWPIQLVYAKTCILPLGRFNALEQAILQIFELFQDKLPSLKEAAEKLGIMDPVIIEAVIRQMLEKNILEKNGIAGPLSFASCRIKTGSLEQENKSSAIETPGVRFCFDAVTYEHIPVPPEAFTDNPVNPVIEPNHLPERRTHIGLDKARQLLEKQQEHFMRESAGLIEITVLPERGKYLWQSLPVTCFDQPDGSLRCQLEQGTELQQQWIDKLDPKHPLFQRLQIKNSDKGIPLTN